MEQPELVMKFLTVLGVPLKLQTARLQTWMANINDISRDASNSCFEGKRRHVMCCSASIFNSVQTRCIVKGKAQKSQLFQQFSGVF